jgi:hypothetical protein
MNSILSECTARARTRVSSRFLAAILWLAFSLVLAGCSSPKATSPQASADADERFDFWKPYDLYLLSSPHPRLYVEVDAVEGCAPSDATLQKLRDFLTTYCHKPEGIEIVRSEVIPIESARLLMPEALARKFINGPPENNTPAPAAFMYVLFYNDDIIDKRVVVETGRHPEPNPTSPSRERIRNPHIVPLPYPAMAFINTRYGGKAIRDVMPLHEAGHLLGLSSRPTCATNNHCLSKKCLMNQQMVFHISRFLLGQDPVEQGQRHLCERCVAELAENVKQSPPSNLRFVGPVLVRSEEGYHVLSLPNRVEFVGGNLTDKDCRDFATKIQNETPCTEGEDDLRVDWFFKKELVKEPAKMHEIINRAKADPLKDVRNIASKMQSEQTASK